jgi:hypothetical protein
MALSIMIWDVFSKPLLAEACTVTRISGASTKVLVVSKTVTLVWFAKSGD